MPEQPGLFDDPAPLARAGDPDTSHQAASKPLRRASQRARLLRVYGDHPWGLNDFEAAAISKIEGGWKRCADLRTAGFIERIGTEDGPKNTPVMVCRITFAGKRMLGLIDTQEPPTEGEHDGITDPAA